MTWRERPATWSRPWLAMWVLLASVTIVSAFLLPPRPWAFVAALCFGVPEAIALIRKGDRYPPLTYVTAHYLPRWLTVSLVGFLVGAIGAGWLGMQRRFFLGALLALHAWALDHFDVTYETRLRWTTDSTATSVTLHIMKRDDEHP